MTSQQKITADTENLDVVISSAKSVRGRISEVDIPVSA